MKKKFKIILLILILLMGIYILRTTYSKYVSKAYGTIDEKIAQWNIKINGTDITSKPGEVIEFEIDEFLWDWDNATHVEYPKVAPGMTGFFDVELDPTGTDVSIQYAIKIDNSKLTEANNINLNIEGIKLNGEEIEYEIKETAPDSGDTQNSEIEIILVKPLEEIKSDDESIRLDKIEVEVKWANNEAYNEQDSAIGSVPNNQIILPILIEVKQYTGEDANDTTNP